MRILVISLKVIVAINSKYEDNGRWTIPMMAMPLPMMMLQMMPMVLPMINDTDDVDNDAGDAGQ